MLEVLHENIFSVHATDLPIYIIHFVLGPGVKLIEKANKRIMKIETKISPLLKSLSRKLQFVPMGRWHS